MQVLSSEFFERNTLEVAPDLIGMLLVHEHESGRLLVGRIVETEAYTQNDPAFHGWGLIDRETGLIRPTGRGFDLFAAPGTAYVYLNYGAYWLLNVVTEPEGRGGAALIRAVEPVEGIEIMRSNRPLARRDRDLTNGPGKLTQAMDIDARYHKTSLTRSPLFFARPDTPQSLAVSTSTRIGLTRGVDLPWRFFVKNNPFVSPGKPSNLVAAGKHRRK